MADTKHNLALMNVAIDRDGGPAYVQIYAAVRGLILEGRLAPGARLPSTRALAEDLNVSRTTTLAAYDQLQSEGYLEGKVGSGAFVSRDIPDLTLEMSAGRPPQKERSAEPDEPRLAARAERALKAPAELPQRAFDPGMTDVRDFPVDDWMRTMARAQRMPDSDWLFARSPGGYGPLREAISDYLRQMRGLDCDPDQVVVTSGARESVELLARTLLDEGDTVWMEDPGYRTVADVLRGQGASIAHVPVDSDGFDPERAEENHADARLAFVTPSRQYPLGMTMPLARRLALIDWAQRTGGWIVEDDYDSEYRYTGRPIAALSSLDQAGRVIYLGSFSKVMFSGLRLGWICVPRSIIPAVLAVQAGYGTLAATPAQPALAEFVSSGRFSAHIRKMRRLYSTRQECLISELQANADDILEVERQDAGLHLVARFRPEPDSRLRDTDVSARAAKEGITAPALSTYFSGPVSRQGLLLGFAGVPTGDIGPKVKTLVSAVRDTLDR